AWSSSPTQRVTLWPATVRCVDSPVGSIWASTHAGVALAVCEMPNKSSSPVTYPTFQPGMSFLAPESHRAELGRQESGTSIVAGLNAATLEACSSAMATSTPASESLSACGLNDIQPRTMASVAKTEYVIAVAVWLSRVPCDWDRVRRSQPALH